MGTLVNSETRHRGHEQPNFWESWCSFTTHQHAQRKLKYVKGQNTSHTSHSLHSHARDMQRVPRSQTRIRVAIPRVNPGSEPVQCVHAARHDLFNCELVPSRKHAPAPSRFRRAVFTGKVFISTPEVTGPAHKRTRNKLRGHHVFALVSLVSPGRSPPTKEDNRYMSALSRL
jgi:hypothetical protein